MWDKLKEQLNILKLEKKKLYLVTNSDKFESKEIFIDAIASALQGGVDVVQLCENCLPDNVVVEIGHKLRMLCDEFGATFLINNRSDIAKIVEADGVHLNANSVGIASARIVLGQNAIIGTNILSAQDAINAFNKGFDYITADIEYVSKDDLKWINENIEIPLFLSGKITLDNVSGYIQDGIKRISIADEIMYAQIPEKTARRFLKFLP